MKPIYLALSKPSERVPLCGSRFWGHPDLPRGYPYPCFPDADGDPFEYTFICQINLSEAAPYDTEGRLPHRGCCPFSPRSSTTSGGSTAGTASRDTSANPKT